MGKHEHDSLAEALHRAGQKVTPQREAVYSVLLDKRDHPTVDEVFHRTRERMPGVSLATVYNCLETFVGCGLVRQVNHEREPTRYCPNLAPHAHFRDQETGQVYDIELPPRMVETLRRILPEEFQTEAVEISFHGKRRK